MHLRRLKFVASVALAMGFLGPNVSASQDTMLVGAPLPLTGPLSPEGLKQKQGYDLWAERANAKGGIKANDKIYMSSAIP